MNPSFELNKHCPRGPNSKRLKLKNSVNSVKGTPDYFNFCNDDFNPANNPFGSQNPFEGQAYCGLVLTSDKQNECSEREFIELKLSVPLIAGNKYLFSI
ncbi:MAG: hypothetical protein ACI9DK_000137 [Vicingaceae bacterium]